MCIFVDDIFALLGAMTIKWVCYLVCGKNKKINNDRIKFATKYESKINCLLTLGNAGCYIWRGTLPKSVTRKSHFAFFSGFARSGGCS